MLLLAVLLVGAALSWFLFRWISRAAQVLNARGLTDFHTGLANRRAFMEELERAWEVARRSGTSLSPAIIDLDEFKAVNDLHGHQAADRVLEAAALRLAGATREGDLLARRRRVRLDSCPGATANRPARWPSVAARRSQPSRSTRPSA